MAPRNTTVVSAASTTAPRSRPATTRAFSRARRVTYSSGSSELPRVSSTSGAPPTSARARFIFPSASLNSRRPSTLSAIQASWSSVSDGAKPARTRNPAPIFPVTLRSTRTSARETRCSTTLTAPPPPKRGTGNAERGTDGAPSWSRTSHCCSAFRLPRSAFASLDRHAFRQVPRLVHVAPPSHRDVVREQLERQHREHGRQQIQRFRNGDRVVGEPGDAAVALRDDRHHAAAACLHLFHVAHDRP